MQRVHTDNEAFFSRVHAALVGVLALILLGVTGCGDLFSSSVPSGDLNSETDFLLTADPPDVSFPQGHSSSLTLTVRSLKGFSGDVDLGTTASSADLTATLEAGSLTVSAGSLASSTLEIGAKLETPPGRYTVTVRGTSGSLITVVSIGVQIESMDHM